MRFAMVAVVVGAAAWGLSEGFRRAWRSAPLPGIPGTREATDA